MIELQTTVPVVATPIISPSSAVLSIGSCFAQNIAGILRDHSISTTINPTGVLYNPFSIEQLLQRLASGEQITEGDLFERDGLWRSFMTHSSLNKPDKQSCLTAINRALERGTDALLNSDTIFLTFGTSFAWRHKQSQQIVSNCQKEPGFLFTKEMLTAECVTEKIESCLQLIRSVNKKANTIVTISPIRYERKEPFLNSVSKSRLFEGVYSACKNQADCFYFPAYEIVMDELRDYRFYADDLRHPSTLTKRILWDRFQQQFCTPEAQGFITSVAPLVRAREHNIETPELAKSFIEKQQRLIEKVEEEFQVSLDHFRTHFF